MCSVKSDSNSSVSMLPLKVSAPFLISESVDTVFTLVVHSSGIYLSFRLSEFQSFRELQLEAPTVYDSLMLFLLIWVKTLTKKKEICHLHSFWKWHLFWFQSKVVHISYQQRSGMFIYDYKLLNNLEFFWTVITKTDLKKRLKKQKGQSSWRHYKLPTPSVSCLSYKCLKVTHFSAVWACLCEEVWIHSRKSER